MHDRSPFGMAGLLERWCDPTDDDLVTFTILTVEANAVVADIHNRIRAIVTPHPACLMETYEISTRANSPRNDGADILRPASVDGDSE